MRISDWSSDVCSSDLGHLDRHVRHGANPEPLPDEGIENDDSEPPPGAAEQHARYPKQSALCQAGKVIQRLRHGAHEMASPHFPAALLISPHSSDVADKPKSIVTGTRV